MSDKSKEVYQGLVEAWGKLSPDKKQNTEYKLEAMRQMQNSFPDAIKSNWEPLLQNYLYEKRDWNREGGIQVEPFRRTYTHPITKQRIPWDIA